ncbi:MAG: hypothetical protein K0Q76_89 [Panacagrimonas sp.]|nr:AMP-binding protein [Panacagrimonas sp.]MCC2654981.1 hypothetical protein [Panacagrimonas sp.]
MRFDQTIVHYLQRHARDTPSAPWLVIASGARVQQFSYADAVDETRRMARMLAARSIGRGDHVFIALTHRHEQYILFLAALWIGAIPTILAPPTPKQDPLLYWRDSGEMIASVGPAIIVSFADNLSALGTVAGATPLVDIDTVAAELDHPLDPADLAEPVEARPDDLPFLQFSSGTTGLRKGVVLDHAAVDAALSVHSQALGLSSRDVIATWLPLYHDMGLVACFLMPTRIGAAIVAIDAFEWVTRPWRLLETIEHFRCTIAWLPNFALQHIVNTLPEDRRFELSSMRAFVSSSEVCRPETFERFATALAPHGLRPDQLATSYGMAETVMAVTQSPPGRAPRVVERDGVRRLSCGPLLDGVGARVSASGEIEIDTRGNTAFSGYFHNPAASDETLSGHWYRTGDLGFIDDGELFVTGRIKDVLVVHGRNYYAHDIEAIVGAVPGIKPGRAVVFAVENPEVGSEDAICVAESTAAHDERGALQRAVKQAVFDRLGLTLRTVAPVEPGWIVKTTSGKMSRAENRTRWLARSAGPIR